MVNRQEIISFINSFLDINSYKDSSSNGLQIMGTKKVSKIALGVSYSLDFAKKAIQNNCQLILVHHGLFWGDIDKIDNSIIKERIKILFDSNMNLAAYHLPLDGHPKIGNNVSLCNEFGFKFEKLFCDYEGKQIGAIGFNEKNISIEELEELMKDKFDTDPIIFQNNNKFSKIGIVSGAAGSFVTEALKEGCDTFITGETKESSPALGKEAKINLIFMGHYNSEKIGIINLGNILKKKFNVDVEFIDIPNKI